MVINFDIVCITGTVRGQAKKSCSRLGLDVFKMVINFDIVCITGTVRGQAKKNNVSIPWKTGKSTIVTHGMIRVKYREDIGL